MVLSYGNANKVILELEIKVGRMMDVPFVTEGTAESNLKVTMECSFPVKQEVGENKSEFISIGYNQSSL
jgi:hypothetical protein